MNDEILQLRLEMLKEDLQAAMTIKGLLTADLAALSIQTRLSDVLNDDFDRFADKLQDDLADELAKLPTIDPADHDALREAWHNYAELRERNAQIHREFLEAMLGLTVRCKNLDNSFCALADALILSINRLHLPDTLAIPASHEAGSRTLARLVRVRFPEWTIWSLPLVAHEFGHVAIEDAKELRDIARTIIDSEAVADPQWVKDPQDEQKRKINQAIRQRVECRVRHFLADVFAVFTIGPSYPCSLILLRLTPGGPNSSGNEPRDIERAEVALEMLRRMAEAAPKPTGYDVIIKTLADEWSGMVTRSGVAPLTTGDEAALKRLVGQMEQNLKDSLGISRYRANFPGGGGWNTAYGWYQAWSAQGKINPRKLPVPNDITRASRIYDALNAAWAYRLFEKPLSLEPVAEATRQLCDKIIKARDEVASREGGGKAGGG